MSGPPPRLAPLPPEEWTDDQRALLRGNLARADRYLSGDPDAPPVPAVLGLFARHPRITGPWLAFSGTLLDHGLLAPRDRELLVLRVAWRTGSTYEWTQHAGMARTAGLTAEQVAAVRSGPGSGVWDDRDGALLRAADALVERHVVDDDTWTELARHFDEDELLEVLFVVGSYLCLALVLNTAGVGRPDPEN